MKGSLDVALAWGYISDDTAARAKLRRLLALCWGLTNGPHRSGPRTEAPRTEAPGTEAPRTEAPRTEAPRTDAARGARKTQNG